MAPPVLSALSNETLATLQMMLDEKILPQTPAWYHINAYVLFVATYILVRLLHDFILPICVVGRTKWWKEFTHEHRRTMVIYVLQVLYTTIALALQLAAIPVFWLEYRPERLNYIQYACTFVSVLYLTELLYRTKMRLPMIAHHLATLFAISIGFSMLFALGDPSFISTGAAWLLQATTEQTTFVALFMYRMKIKMRLVRALLFISAAQSLIFKLFSTALTTFYWAKYQRFPDSSDKPATVWAWNFMFWVATITLMFTQFYGSWILYVMAKSVKGRYDTQKPNTEITELVDCKDVDNIAPPPPSTAIGSPKQESSRSPKPESSMSPKQEGSRGIYSPKSTTKSSFAKGSAKELLRTVSHQLLYPVYESSSEEEQGNEVDESGMPQEGM